MITSMWYGWGGKLLGLFICIAGLVLGVIKGSVVSATKIERDVVTINGISAEYLQNFPEK